MVLTRRQYNDRSLNGTFNEIIQRKHPMWLYVVRSQHRYHRILEPVHRQVQMVDARRVKVQILLQSTDGGLQVFLLLLGDVRPQGLDQYFQVGLSNIDSLLPIKYYLLHPHLADFALVVFEHLVQRCATLGVLFEQVKAVAFVSLSGQQRRFAGRCREFHLRVRTWEKTLCD